MKSTIASNLFLKGAAFAIASLVASPVFATGLYGDVATLSISATGKLDLTDNGLIVRATNYATVRNYVISGFNAGGWDGFGVASSAAAGAYPKALGLVDNSITNYPSFFGVPTVASTETLVRFTYYGDADLNGVVNGDDLNLLIDGLGGNTPANDWVWGDFDFSGAVTGDDLNLFIDGYNLPQIPPAPAPAMLLDSAAAVPEPTSMLMIGAGLTCLLARRRPSK